MAIDLKDIKKLKGSQKVAIVLLSMSEQNATKMFSMMNEEDIKEVSHAMSNLGSVEQEVVDQVLNNFMSSFGGENSYFGSLQTTRKLLDQVLEKDRVDSLMEEIQGPQGKNTWEKLGSVNEEILALYLRNEHPQTASLVISKMSSDHASKVLSNLPEEFTYEVIVRMMNMGSVKKEVLDKVEKILRAEFISSISKTHKRDSYELIAEIFNSFDRSNENKFMSKLEKDHPEYAERIKNLMFTFEDLTKLDSRSIQILLKGIDKSKLTFALKGASDKIKDLFLKNMSQRAARIIQEELESMGRVKVREVDDAQGEIINVAKELINRGEIEVSEDGEDEYI